MSLTDVEVLLGGALSGGLGLVWHRGGGGCGLRADVVLKARRVSSETLCPADSLRKRSQNGNQIEKCGLIYFFAVHQWQHCAYWDGLNGMRRHTL